jgi:hypothetical protein
VNVEYDGSKLLKMTKIEDEDDIKPPPFSLLYYDLHTYSGLLASEDSIRLVIGMQRKKFDLKIQMRN